MEGGWYELQSACQQDTESHVGLNGCSVTSVVQISLDEQVAPGMVASATGVLISACKWAISGLCKVLSIVAKTRKAVHLLLCL